MVPAEHLYALRSVASFSLLAWRAARHEMDELADHAAAGRLEVAVQASVPLAEAASAHALLEDRTRLGRVLLTP